MPQRDVGVLNLSSIVYAYESPSARKGTKCSFRCRVQTPDMSPVMHLRINFEAQSGKNLPPCNFHGVLAKFMNSEPKLGH
jgi:hypothetical protein